MIQITKIRIEDISLTFESESGINNYRQKLAGLFRTKVGNITFVKTDTKQINQEFKEGL